MQCTYNLWQWADTIWNWTISLHFHYKSQVTLGVKMVFSSLKLHSHQLTNDFDFTAALQIQFLYLKAEWQLYVLCKQYQKAVRYVFLTILLHSFILFVYLNQLNVFNLWLICDEIYESVVKWLKIWNLWNIVLYIFILAYVMKYVYAVVAFHGRG